MELTDPGPMKCLLMGWLVAEDKTGWYISAGLAPGSGAPHSMIHYVIKKDIVKTKWLSGI